MDFAQQQRHPAKHVLSMTFVILLHVIVIYALINGLARKVVDVVRKPLEVKIIEEQKPPPPPEIQLPPPPKLAAPPPPFIPPPEVHIEAPPTVNATITAVTSAPPPPTAVLTHAPPAPAPAPAAPAAAPAKNVIVVCPNTKQVASEIEFPGRAARERISSGDVTVQFTVGANGSASNFAIAGSTNRIFNDTALEAAQKLKCIGQGQDVRVELPVHFRLQD